MLGGFVIRHYMGAWTLLIKSLGLCLAVASGMWLGKEGPLVHVACCCANLIMKPFENLRGNEGKQHAVRYSKKHANCDQRGDAKFSRLQLQQGSLWLSVLLSGVSCLVWR